MEITDGSASVCFEMDAACGVCEGKSLCHAAGSPHVIIARNAVGARVNDRVYVEQATGAGLLSAFILFGVPVILALIGIFLGDRFAETASLIGAVTGFFVGLAIAKLVNERISRASALMPMITEVVREEGS